MVPPADVCKYTTTTTQAIPQLSKERLACKEMRGSTSAHIISGLVVQPHLPPTLTSPSLCPSP